MNKIEIIARRIMGWKLNTSQQWFDVEKGVFIKESEFQPEHNLEHAMLIVERLEKFGITYTKKSDSEVCFNDICASGKTLAEAITNAAYEIADISPISDDWLKITD